MKKSLLTLATMACLGCAFAQSTLDKVSASGSITLGVRESSGALSYAMGDGRYAGMHVEICQRIVTEMEKKLGKKIEVNLLQVTAPTRIALLQNGTIDIESGNTTNTTTRLNLPASDSTKAAWQSPNDKPMEDYNKKP